MCLVGFTVNVRLAKPIKMPVRAMARASGLSSSMVSRWASGEAGLSIENAWCLLGCVKPEEMTVGIFQIAEAINNVRKAIA